MWRLYLYKGESVFGWLNVQVCGKFGCCLFSFSFFDTVNVVNVSILHDGTSRGAFPVHTIFTDCDHISRSQQCPRFSTENFTLLSD